MIVVALRRSPPVFPAKAGTHRADAQNVLLSRDRALEQWVPAFAGKDKIELASLMNDADTTMKSGKFDWSRADAMSDAEVHEAALRDPDAQPLTEEEFARLRRVPRTITLRRGLRLSQEDFAARFHIPLGTLRDWEEGRAEPDQPARAYLRAIAGDPDAVQRALRTGPEAGR